MNPDTCVIPTLDMSRYFNGEAHDREIFCQQLCDTGHDIGFFYLKNHGIPASLLNEVLTQANLFFHLPQHEKNNIDITHSPHFRGYGKLNAETTGGIADYKETYDLGLERQARSSQDKPYLNLHGPNQWPSSLQPVFSGIIQSYMNQMLQLGQHTMHAVASGLGISNPDFSNSFDITAADTYAMLRLLHYPPASHNTNQFGVGAHVDAGCLVFLLQDEIGGLQVQNRSGEWLDVPPLENHFIVNIGEMLQVWTNQYFTATPHRVLNNTHHDRISAPFFFEPNLSAVISPMPIFNQPVIDNDINVIYGEHMLKVFQRSFAI